MKGHSAKTFRLAFSRGIGGAGDNSGGMRFASIECEKGSSVEVIKTAIPRRSSGPVHGEARE